MIKKYPLLFILFLALVLRLVNLNQSFWLDEAAQVIESARPLSQQFNIAADFHPPGFHLLLFVWMLFGHSEIWIRLLPLGFGLGSVFLIYHIAKALGYQKHATWVALFLAISPYHIWYSQETRPYSMFVFTSLLATYLLIKHSWKHYAFSVMWLLYSLYFAPFVLMGHIVYVLVVDRKQIKQFMMALFIGCLTFIPWVPSFLEQLRIGTGGAFAGWTSVVSVVPIKAIPLTIAKFLFGHGSFFNKTTYAFALIPSFVISVLAVILTWKSKRYRSIYIFFLIPLVSAMAISLVVPVIAPQRLIFLLPLFLLLLAAGIESLQSKYRVIALGVILLTSSIGVLQYYTDPGVQREQWRQASQYVDQTTYRALSLFAFPEPFAPYYWYASGRVPGYGYAPKFIVQPEDLSALTSAIRNKDRLFVFQYLTGLTDPDNTIQRTLMYAGFAQTDIKNFPGVGFVYVYDKK
jgi:mannosyltransferase